jgi:hypothetical protein
VIANFAADQLRIAGYIKNGCNVPIAGVLVDADNGGGEDTTDSNGFYELWVGNGWSGTVSPAKQDYTFNPNSRNYTNVLSDQVDQNYVADNVYDLDCDGSIGLGDVGVIADNWLLEGPGNPADLAPDEIVNFLDFAEFGNIWKDK